jgi:hypothetical protein
MAPTKVPNTRRSDEFSKACTLLRIYHYTSDGQVYKAYLKRRKELLREGHGEHDDVILDVRQYSAKVA